MSGKITKQLNTVRVKIVVVPLILLLSAIIALASVTYQLVEQKMVAEMQSLGFTLVEQAMERLVDSEQTLDVIDQMLNDKILGAARAVLANQDQLSSAYLTQLATAMGVDAIHWFNSSYQVTHSAFDLILGWVAPASHPVVQFDRSGQSEWVEEIRKAEGSDDYYKYGYVRGPKGEIVQVGILANSIQALTDEFSYQRLMDELAANDEVVFALVIDRNRVGIAHSNHERIGLTFDDAGTFAAAQHGEAHAQEYYYEPEDVTVYDVQLPFYLNGEHVGAIRIGLSMGQVYGAIRDILIQIIKIGGAAFVILGTVLVLVSRGILSSLHVNRTQLRYMAAGDFTQQIPDRYLKRSDEFGEMARDVEHTQGAMQKLLGELTRTALDVATTSQELSASTEETSASIEEVASASNQFASTVEQMDSRAQAMASSATQILNATKTGNEGVMKAVGSTAALQSLMGEIAHTVEKLGEQSHQISEIVDVITGIAEQTNLLALNAAIEAARAGEHGRGFAVVAEEVRNLAEQSAASAAHITDLVRSIQGETQDTITGIKQGVKQAEENTEIVHETGSLISNIMESVNGIIAQLGELSNGLAEINTGSQEMAATTEEQSASVDSIARSAQTLSHMSERLQELVSQFKLSNNN